MSLPAIQPNDDMRELFLYSDAVQQHVRTQLDLCEEIESATDGVTKAAARIALRFHGERGMSGKSVLKRYYDYKKSGDWRLFIPKYKRADKSVPLPLEFLEYWRGLCQQNQRKCRPAWRSLIAKWNRGEPVPGFGTWREYWTRQGLSFEANDKCPPDLPAGWSYRNLMRVKPDKADLTLARHGIAATRNLLPHVIGTREGMRPLEYLAFDDVELDFLVVVPGVERPCKLRAIVVKDVATDCWLRYVLRPALVREDGKQDGLKLRDMKRLCCELLMNFGYPVDYASHWIVERGTATLPEPDMAALAQISNGMIQVHQTSMVSGKVLLGGYSDKAVGNSWGKAWIESGFNRVHNELAVVKGQKGLSYSAAPAELETRKKDAVKLIKAGKALPPDLRVLLRLPFTNIYEATDQLYDALLRINVDQDHKCEGFEEIVQWRLTKGDQWKPYEQLLELPPEMMDHVMTNRRLETRMERWARMIQGVAIQRLPNEAAPRWMDEHRKVRVEKYQIKIQHEGKTHTYFDRDSALLLEAAEYVAWFNPFDMEYIYLTDVKRDGAYRGRLPRVQAVRRDDQEALERRMADVRGALNDRILAVRDRSIPDTEQAIEDAEQNIALFNETDSVPVVAALNGAVAETTAAREQETARRKAARKYDASTLLHSRDDDDFSDDDSGTGFDASALL